MIRPMPVFQSRDGRSANRCSQPCRYDRWSQSLEVTFGEVMPSGEPPLLKHRRELMRNEAIKLWAQKRRAGWQACEPQWIPPQPPRV
ncbi:DUF1651 domain-containing protein [Cyanobium sp. BA20m-14]|nr:DUF1651 domain-containing protein [Cyanobium sp. BA20m-14]